MQQKYVNGYLDGILFQASFFGQPTKDFARPLHLTIQNDSDFTCSNYFLVKQPKMLPVRSYLWLWIEDS